MDIEVHREQDRGKRGVYCFTCLHSLYWYVGSSMQPISNRWSGHWDEYVDWFNRKRASWTSSFPLLALSEEAPDDRVILFLLEEYTGDSREELLVREQYWINKFGDRCINYIRVLRTSPPPIEPEPPADTDCDLCGDRYAEKNLRRHLNSENHQAAIVKMLKTDRQPLPPSEITRACDSIDHILFVRMVCKAARVPTIPLLEQTCANHYAVQEQRHRKLILKLREAPRPDPTRFMTPTDREDIAKIRPSLRQRLTILEIFNSLSSDICVPLPK